MAESDTIQIKRYPNRRFYARDSSNYVSLGDIEEMIAQGRTVEIVDSKTGEDLTGSVLTQIIMERQPDKMALFPTPMLHSILQANDVASEFFRDYFQNCLTCIDDMQSQSAKIVPGPQQPMQWMRSWFDNMYGASADESDATPTGSAPRTETEAKPDKANTELEDRLAQMEKRLRELEAES